MARETTSRTDHQKADEDGAPGSATGPPTDASAGTPETDPIEHRRGWLAWVVLGLVVFTAAYATVLISFARTDGRHEDVYPTVGGQGANQIRVVASVLKLDPVGDSYQVRLSYQPTGAFRNADSDLAKPVSVVTDDVNGTKKTDFPAGARMSATDLDIHAPSDTARYPFDKYRFTVDLIIRDAQGNLVPTQMVFSHWVGDWALASKLGKPNVDGHVALDITAKRSPSVLMLSIGLMLVLVVLVVVNVLMVMRAIRIKKVEFTILASLGAMLFAIPGIRNAMPNTPPVGTLSDFLVFFWGLIMIGLCLAASAVAWLRQASTDLKKT